MLKRPSASTLSINQSAENVGTQSSSTLFQSVSPQDDPGNCFNKLQLRWKIFS
jgi:hypothetical protein